MLAGAVALGVAACRAWTRSRLRALRAESGAEHWTALDVRPDGRPAVVAFSTPSCAECRVQERILRRLPGVRVLPVDAHDRSQVASRFGVLTVPSTVVLRADGTVAAMNHGFADDGRLRSQLEGLGASERAAAG